MPHGDLWLCGIMMFADVGLTRALIMFYLRQIHEPKEADLDLKFLVLVTVPLQAEAEMV